MRVLVTGASGYVGTRLVAQLLQDKADVVAVGRTAPPVSPTSGTLRFVEAEFHSFEGWADLLDGVTTIYHLAWSSLPNTASATPAIDATENILGTLRLLEALRERPGIRLVFASSGGTVYGQVEYLPIDEQHPTHPISAYGVSKLAVESYLRFYHVSYGLRPISLRIANIYGPGQVFGRKFGVIGTFAGSMIKGEEITIFGDGSVIRDYVYVNDVVEAFITAARSLSDIDTYNIGSGEGRSLNHVIAAVSAVLETVPAVRYLPGRPFDVPTSVLDIGRARARLDWRPKTAFKEGLTLAVLALKRRITAI